jgi:orotidine-5'-phosphate decarboxylase
MSHNPIIVALDLESAEEARALVRRLRPRVNFFKVGLELYAAEGMPFVDELIAEGCDVFLDLKLYDIPETVRRAVTQIVRHPIRFLTIHAVRSVMRAATEGRGASGVKLLAVTVLTSFGPEDLRDLGHTAGASELVADRTRQAIECGVEGVVCSPLEAAAVRAIAGPRLKIVTPGVRSAGAARADQKRVATPAEAVRDGADYIVIGREITRAADPAAEADRILGDLETGRAAAPANLRP